MNPPYGGFIILSQILFLTKKQIYGYRPGIHYFDRP